MSTTPRRDRVDADAARRELDGEVADERLERGLRRADERVVLEHADRAEARDRRRSTSRRGIAGAAARVEREQRARVRVERPVPVLVLGLERGRITPVAALWTKTSSGPSAATCSSTRSEVTLPRTSTGSAPSARSSLGRLLGGGVRAHVADRDAGRALAREAERDRLADPARAAGDEDASGPSARSSTRARQRVGRRRRRRDRLPADPRRATRGSSSSAFDDA